MATTLRQKKLLAAEDFTALYESFASANFKAYDYDSIREALINYVQDNYAEDYNDWIESSEFVALVDLFSFIGHSIAFRLDLTTRENILDTATKSSSVLNLARFVGYNPSRCNPATGLLKLKALRTTETIYDFNGTDIGNTDIIWGDASNTDYYEQFITVLNRAFQTINQFGNPYKKGTVDNISTEVYKLNSNIEKAEVTYPFTAIANGSSHSFEVVNGSFKDTEYFYEDDPDPSAAMSLYYRNDGTGFLSKDTGFFVMFKQGSLQHTDYTLDKAIENRVIDIDTENINNTDVWVQNISADGTVTTANKWTKVDSTEGNNVIYNSLNKNIRKIFSVISRLNDTISIKFADGNYGEIPRNLMRVWYRTSNGDTYVLRSADVQDVSITIPYIGIDGLSYDLTCTFDLEYTVRTATATESVDNIKQNAPLVYASQNRMVSAQDYTVFPYTQSSAVKKVKAVNRTNIGHNRFLTFNDPTGVYTNLNIFGSDGYIYKDSLLKRKIITLPSTYTNQEIADDLMTNMLFDADVMNFYYENYPKITATPYLASSDSAVKIFRQVSSTSTTSTGYFKVGGSLTTAAAVGTSYTTDSILKVIKKDALLGFVEPATGDTEASTWASSTAHTITWAKVLSVTGSGLGTFDTDGNYTGKDTAGVGTISLSQRIPDNARILYAVPHFRRKFTSSERDLIVEQLSLKNSFGIGYDEGLDLWWIVDEDNISEPSTTFARNVVQDNTNTNPSWIIRAEVKNNKIEFLIRHSRYIFSSDKEVRFYNPNIKRSIDVDTNKPVVDQISVLGTNTKPGETTLIGSDIKFNPVGTVTYNDGYSDPTKLIISPADENLDLVPDFPDSFEQIVGADTNKIYFNKVTEGGYEYERYTPNTTTTTKTGRATLKFQWKHYATDERKIDPSASNIIDIFVLTENYDNEFREWLAANGSVSTKPAEPTQTDLNTLLSGIKDYKMSSDEIVFKPVKYKILFGQKADLEMQARFKVIKAPGINLTDNEIKSKVITAIDAYFNVENWDFGETFYFTELSAYIHQSLAGIVSSVVIVPISQASVFGDLFQITPNLDEVFISSAHITDVEIVSALTDTNLRTTATTATESSTEEIVTTSFVGGSTSTGSY